MDTRKFQLLAPFLALCFSCGDASSPKDDDASGWETITAGVGLNHSCAIREGALWCWGDNEWNQLGTTSVSQSHAPVSVRSDLEWSSFSAGGRHNCGITAEGQLYCWGSNEWNQLGLGKLASEPTQVAADFEWRGVRAGVMFSMGLATDGTWAWGSNESGELGIGTKEAHLQPTRQADANEWMVLEAGRAHGCGIRADQSMWCWGANHDGQLGFESGFLDPVQPEPTKVEAAVGWKQMGLGSGHTCAIDDGNCLWCWGYNGFAQLGNGQDPDELTPPETWVRTPTQIGEQCNWRSVAGGAYHSCGIQDDDSLWCWGDNEFGHSNPDDPQSYVLSPTRLGTENSWQWVDAGLFHSCAMTTDAAIWCWGDNRLGQSGGPSEQVTVGLTEIEW